MHFSFPDELCLFYGLRQYLALPAIVPTIQRIPAFLDYIFRQENAFNGIL